MASLAFRYYKNSISDSAGELTTLPGSLGRGILPPHSSPPSTPLVRDWPAHFSDASAAYGPVTNKKVLILCCVEYPTAVISRLSRGEKNITVWAKNLASDKTIAYALATLSK